MNIPISHAVKGRILLFSYAFPPMQVQMTAAVYKPMAAIGRSGFLVDVLCADSFCRELPLDHSLAPFVQKTFRTVTRLCPSSRLLSRLRVSSRVLSRVPDLMTVLQEAAYEALMDMDLSQYDVVMTWSPFHSINAVMAKVKRARPQVKWIAQFSDPWAGNPLEISSLTKLWNRWNQPSTVKSADAIVHSSRYSLELMLKDDSALARRKAHVIPHAYDDELFPKRRKASNAKVILRYVGVLYGRRSPESLFAALAKLFLRRPDLRHSLTLELVGLVPVEMLKTSAALGLPEGTVVPIGNVSFVESLEKMYDADILVMIEADIRQNLFLPSKLSDYFGSRTPIVGLVPPGGSEDALQALGCWYSRPSDVDAISRSLEAAINHVSQTAEAAWCDEPFRTSFSGEKVAGQFINIMNRI